MFRCSFCLNNSFLFQCGSGSDKYSNKSRPSVTTSAVISLGMSMFGVEMKVQNLSKPITVEIPQPVNPYPPTLLVAYTHILKSVSVVDVRKDNKSSIFIETKNTTEVRSYS